MILPVHVYFLFSVQSRLQTAYELLLNVKTVKITVFDLYRINLHVTYQGILPFLHLSRMDQLLLIQTLEYPRKRRDKNSRDCNT